MIQNKNSNCEKQVIFSMIPNEEKRERSKTLAMRAKSEGRKANIRGQWHYLEVKKLSSSLTSKHNGDFYCLNCLHSFATEKKLELHKKVLNRIVSENKGFCNVIMPSEDTKILEFNQYQKSDKAPFIIYANLEFIIEKIDGCKSNSENSFTTKVSNYIPSGFSVSTISLFRDIENKHNVYRGKYCMKKFCECLRQHAMKIINLKKKKTEIINKRAAGVI